MIQEWHCEVCGRGGKTHINDHADAQSGSARIADSHRRKSPTCHRTRRLEKVRIRAPHCTDKEWEEVLMVVEGYDRKDKLSRTLCWFSCGAPSAVAAKLTVSVNPLAQVLYTRIEEEHADNMRFLMDCERWLGVPIRSMGNLGYKCSIYEVFERERYLVGIQGAPCTKLLKRRVREEYQRSDDIHVLGYTIEEAERLAEFRDAYPELTVSCPLIERGLTKSDCLAMIEREGIALPAMYLLGFNNNNCVGCVKGGMGYWNRIRIHFPDRFAQMAKMERNIGHSINRRDGKPIYLDELPEDAGRDLPEPKIDCSIMCLIAEQEYSS